MSRKQKLLRVVIFYAILIGLVVAASSATTDVEFRHYQTIGSPAVQAENYFGQFFETGWLVVGIGFLFALIWAGRLKRQRPHARWFKRAVIVTSVLTLLGAIFSVGLSRIDCGSGCVWYVLPEGLAYIMGILSTLFWFGTSILIYKFMLRYSVPE